MPREGTGLLRLFGVRLRPLRVPVSLGTETEGLGDKARVEGRGGPGLLLSDFDRLAISNFFDSNIGTEPCWQ